MTGHGDGVMSNIRGEPNITALIFGWEIYRVFREGTDIIKIILKKDNEYKEFTS